MLPVESVFTPLPLLVVEPWVEQHLYNGCPTSRYPAADGRYRVRNAAGQFLGLANITGGRAPGGKTVRGTELTRKRKPRPMQIISQFVPLPLADPAQGTAVAMGYFDGIHIGHRAVINGAVQWAKDPRCSPGGVYLPPAGGKQNEGQAPALHRG